MLRIDPRELIFRRESRQSSASVTTLAIHNTLDTQVSFTVDVTAYPPFSYTVVPSKVKVLPGDSVMVNVTLEVESWVAKNGLPDPTRREREYLAVRTPYFEQKVPLRVVIVDGSRGSRGSSQRRSVSSSRRGSGGGRHSQDHPPPRQRPSSVSRRGSRSDDVAEDIPRTWQPPHPQTLRRADGGTRDHSQSLTSMERSLEHATLIRGVMPERRSYHEGDFAANARPTARRMRRERKELEQSFSDSPPSRRGRDLHAQVGRQTERQQPDQIFSNLPSGREAQYVGERLDLRHDGHQTYVEQPAGHSEGKQFTWAQEERSQPGQPMPHQEQVGGTREYSQMLAHSLSPSSSREEVRHLRNALTEFQSGMPNVQALVDSALARERLIFEERSHKALELLHQKDGTIEELQADLERERSQVVEIKDNARTLENTNHDLQTENASLHATVRSLQADLEHEQSLMLQKQKEWSEKEANLTSVEAVMKLRAELTEKDHELEVVLAEVARLKEAVKELEYETDTLRSRSQKSKKIIEEQRKDLSNVEQRLEQEKAKLEEQEHRSRRQLKSLEANIKTDFQAQASNDLRAREKIITDLNQQVHDLEKSVFDRSQIISGKDSTIEQLKNQLGRYEQEFQTQSESETQWRLKTEAMEVELTNASKRIQKLEELQRTAQETILLAEQRLRKTEKEKKVLMEQSKNSVSWPQPFEMGKPTLPLSASIFEDGTEGQQSGKNRICQDPQHKAYLDAQVWWLHFAGRERDRKAFQGTNAWAVDMSMDTQLERMKTIVEDQALEVTNLRQEILQQHIENRKLKEHWSEKEAAFKMQILSTEQALQNAKEAGMTRLQELEQTVRIMAGRGHLEDAYAAARQELSAERVNIIRYKGDLDMYGKLLEEEKSRHKQTLKRAEDLQNILERSKIEQSFESIAGVGSPVDIIEHFAGTAKLLKEENASLTAQLELLKGKSGTKRKKQMDGKPYQTQGIGNPEMAEEVSTRSSNQQEHIAITGNQYNHILDQVKSQQCSDQISELEGQIRLLQEEIMKSQSQTRELKKQSEREKGALQIQMTQKVESVQMETISWKAEVDALRRELHNMEVSNAEIGEELSKAKAENEKLRNTSKFKPKDRSDVSHDVGRQKNVQSTEIARLKSLVEEKTTQVQVLSQTIDALQAAMSLNTQEEHSAPNLNDSSAFLENGVLGVDLGALARAPLNVQDSPSSPSTSGLGHWAVRGLIKRVIKLTHQLSTATSFRGAMERRSHALESELEKTRAGSEALEERLDAVTKDWGKAVEERNQEASARSEIESEGEKLARKLRLEKEADQRRALKLEQDLRAVKEDLASERRAKTALEEAHRTQERTFQLSANHGTASDEMQYAAGVGDAYPYADEEQSPILSMLSELLDQWRRSVEENKGDIQDFLGHVRGMLVRADQECLKSARKLRALEWKFAITKQKQSDALLELKDTNIELDFLRQKLSLHEEEKRMLRSVSNQNSASMMSLLQERNAELTENLSKLITKNSAKRGKSAAIRRENGLIKARLNILQLREDIQEREVRLSRLAAIEEMEASFDVAITEMKEDLRHWFRSELTHLCENVALLATPLHKFEGGTGSNETSNGDQTFAGLLWERELEQSALQLRLDRTFQKLSAARERGSELRILSQKYQAAYDDLAQQVKAAGLSPPDVSASDVSMDVSWLETHTPSAKDSEMRKVVQELREKLLLTEQSLGMHRTEMRKVKDQLALESASRDKTACQLKELKNQYARNCNEEICVLREQTAGERMRFKKELAHLQSQLFDKNIEIQDFVAREGTFGMGYDGAFPPKLPSQEDKEQVQMAHFGSSQDRRDFEEEKAIAEAHQESLIQEVAGLRAECSFLKEDLAAKDSAIESMKASLAQMDRAMTESTPESSALLADQLAKSQEVEARQSAQLRAAASREIDLRTQIEQLEHRVTQMKYSLSELRQQTRDGLHQKEPIPETLLDDEEEENWEDDIPLPRGALSPDKRIDSESTGTPPKSWHLETSDQLRRRITDQAAIIRHLELRVAELTLDNERPYSNLKSYLGEIKAQKKQNSQQAIKDMEDHISALTADKENLKKELENRLSIVNEEKERLQKQVDHHQQMSESLRMQLDDEKAKQAQTEVRNEPSSSSSDLIYSPDGDMSLFAIKDSSKGQKPSSSEILQGYAESLEGLRTLKYSLENLLSQRQQDMATEAETLSVNTKSLTGMLQKLQKSIDRLEQARKENEASFGMPTTTVPADLRTSQEMLSELVKVREKVNTLQQVVQTQGSNPKAEHDSMIRLIRDLKRQVKELQSAQKEKLSLEEEIVQLRTEIVCERKAHWDATQIMRAKYEATLTEIEESADTEKQGLVSEVERLQTNLKNSEKQASEMKQDHEVMASETLVRLKNEVQEAERRVDRMQNQLEEARRGWDVERRGHLDHVDGLRAQMAAYREAQDKLMETLQSQLRLARNRDLEMSSVRHEEVDDLVGEVMTQLQDRDMELCKAHADVQRLDFQHKIKCAELDAALGMLKHKGSGKLGRGSDSSKDKPIREAILEAKNSVLEKEVERLNMELLQSSEVQAKVRRQLMVTRKAKKKDENLQEERAQKVKAEKDAQSLQKELKKAKDEINKLRGVIGQRSQQKKSEQDWQKLNNSLKDSSATIQSLREDNQRKSKLLAQLRSSKSEDSGMIEKLKKEIGGLENKLQRTQREISQKAELVKSLRTRVNEQKEAEKSTNQKDQDDHALQKRLWDADRNRLRNVVQSLRQKVQMLERQIQDMTKEGDAKKGVKGKVSSLRSEIQKLQRELHTKAVKLQEAKSLLEAKSLETQRATDGLKEDKDKQIAQYRKDLSNISALRSEEHHQLEALRSLALDCFVHLFETTARVVNEEQKRTKAKETSEEFFSIQESSGQVDMKSVEPIATMLDMSASEVQDILSVDGSGHASISIEEAKAEEVARIEFNDRIMQYLSIPINISGLNEIFQHLVLRLLDKGKSPLL